MDELKYAGELVRGGRFAEALPKLSLSFTGTNRVIADRLLVEALERTGRYRECREAVARLYRGRTVTPQLRAVCELALARIEIDAGLFEAAIQHLQRAIALAGSVDDLELTCKAQLRLFSVISDRAGHDSGAALLSTLRVNVLKLGSPSISAGLHLAVAEVDGRRGLLTSALRHTETAQRLLEPESDLWYESWIENHLLAISILRSDFERGLQHGTRALSLSERSGAVGARRTCLANLGNLFYARGDFDQAIDHLERARACLPTGGEHASGGLESLARVHLSQGHLEQSAALLDEIERAIRSHRDQSLYAYRHSLLTRGELLLHENRLTEAQTVVARALTLAQSGSDELLQTQAHLLAAEIFASTNSLSEAEQALLMVAGPLAHQPPDLFVRYERALGCGLVAQGSLPLARQHLERALRLSTGLHHIPATRDVDSSLRRLLAVEAECTTRHADQAERDANVHSLHDVIGILANVERPEIVAGEVAALLTRAGAMRTAKVERWHEEFRSNQVAIKPDSGDLSEITLHVGISSPVHYVVHGRLEKGFESVATLNAVRFLLSRVEELEQARNDREQRLTLWPAEELPIDEGHGVLTGKMRDLMTQAQRVARTNVSVLITGESGTGKEVLARAIHAYSARADKPFIPFNCTAIPRDLLESQLFGHRRGAFTGAERDHPGLIRAAKDGTLFLDEIGELSLDLQPKLLRFLESGEINPLGEPSPFNVNVRIIAATNSNLEELVQEHRFREDLFYRLNVIRLTIPPLRERRDEIPPLVHHFVARACTEFSKSRVRVAEETMEHLLLFPWPGNIRQLNNELRRMVALADNDTMLPPSALSPAIRRAARPAARLSNGLEISVPLTDKLAPTIARIEREMIRLALRTNHGHVDQAAKALGISRKGLYLKRQRLGL